MNLGEAKKRALSLMAEYSINGVITPGVDNADYLIRMNGFAHDAQMEISEKVGIGASEIYTQVAESGEGYNIYSLPPDFKQLRNVYHRDRVFSDFRIQNNNLLLNKSLSGNFELIYFKNPTEINSDTPDSYEFEVDKHTHHLIPYFVGGMAIHDENPSMADRLINMYFNRLNGTQKKLEDYPMDIFPIYSINNL